MLQERLAIDIQGTAVDLSLARRRGDGIPILFLHGWGSSKEDFIDIQHLAHAGFKGRPFVAYDAPGCGQTICEDLSKVNIAFLVTTAETVLTSLGIDKVHIVGHSMGGLTALQLARQKHFRRRVCSFVNIKGNLAPEDCFLSRQINQYHDGDSESFLEAFILRASLAPLYSSALYASVLRHRIHAGAMSGIFRSMVHLSDHGDLLTAFTDLECHRVFMYGEQYADLSYLPELDARGVVLSEIPQSGHFPMYSNPVAMWDAIHRCICQVEKLNTERHNREISY